MQKNQFLATSHVITVKNLATDSTNESSSICTAGSEFKVKHATLLYSVLFFFFFFLEVFSFNYVFTFKQLIFISGVQ